MASTLLSRLRDVRCDREPFTPDDVEQSAAVEQIMKIMLALSWEQREQVWHAITYNDIFCVHCGLGSELEPNSFCQCQNDE